MLRSGPQRFSASLEGNVCQIFSKFFVSKSKITFFSIPCSGERRLFAPANRRPSTRCDHQVLRAEGGDRLRLHPCGGVGPAGSGPRPQPFLPPLLPRLPPQAILSRRLRPLLHHRRTPEAHVHRRQAQRGAVRPSEGPVLLHRARFWGFIRGGQLQRAEHGGQLESLLAGCVRGAGDFLSGLRLRAPGGEVWAFAGSDGARRRRRDLCGSGRRSRLWQVPGNAWISDGVWTSWVLYLGQYATPLRYFYLQNTNFEKLFQMKSDFRLRYNTWVYKLWCFISPSMRFLSV